MTGHVCFGKFLWRVRRRRSASCDFCDEDGCCPDGVTHTLRRCGMWEPQRTRLKEKLSLDADFILSDVASSIIETKDAWLAFSAFAEEVMRKKEEEERH